MQTDQKTYERFIAKVCPEPNSGCWLWMGAYSDDGYGTYGAKRGHCISYEIFIGPIPHGYHVHHKCETTGCVNPDHLEALTPAEHVRETIKSLRSKRKAIARSSSTPTIQQIIDLCGGADEIADATGISAWAVYKWPKIGIHRKNWDLIMALAKVTVDQIYNANLRARGTDRTVPEHEGAAA